MSVASVCPCRAPIRRFLLLVLVGLATAVPQPAAAQSSDWGVRRDPFDRSVIQRYKALLRKNPHDRDALRKLVGLYKRHRDVALLVSEYREVLAKQPEDVNTHIVLGHLHQLEGQSEPALEHFGKAAELARTDASLLLTLGQLYRQSGRTDDARASYRRALTASTAAKVQKEVLRALAELALGAGDLPDAKGHYEKYLELAPNDVDVRLALGDALTAHSQPAAAVAVYEAAEKQLRSDPARRVEVVARLGKAHEAARDEEAALREYRRAMAMVDRDYYLRKELVDRVIDIFRRRQELPALIGQYESEWGKSSRTHFEWSVLARLYEETGNQERAIEAYQQAVRKAPHELETQRKLITLLENAGHQREALQRYQAAINVAPGEPSFQLELAQRYWDSGEPQKALALLARMERRFPSDPNVHAAIAELYTRWGKEDLALASHVR